MNPIPAPYTFKGNKNYKSIIIGKAIVLKKNIINIKRYKITDINLEINKLERAINSVKEEIELLQDKIDPKKEKSIYDIFDFYKISLDDEYYFKDVIEEINIKKLNVAHVLYERHKKTIEFFNSLEDPKMREKKDDLDFLIQKILSYLLKDESNNTPNTSTNTENTIKDKNIKEKVIFSENISPLDLILFYHQGIKAIVTEEGTFTSHTSIIASTLDISYIMGINNCLEIVKNDDIVIIDGFTGEIFINPEECVISQYKIKEKEQIKILNELANESISKSYTKDNKYIKIMSNMDIIEAPNSIDKYNVEGIGLARSEFMFHDREIIPSYQEQLLVYKELLIKNKNTEVTIRTFDFSEDKTPDTLKIFNQHNPSMGLRGIRFSFYQNIFKDQFKALIKSSLFGNLKILFPMITSYKEFLEIKKIESEILEELQIKKTYKIGIMVETISSVYILQDIYKEIDFVSLGTNDLMQYFFAVDRDNGFVKDLSSPFESSFIRFLKYVISEVNKYSIELSICGKIASVPSVIPILIGLDLETLSVSPLYIPIVKRIIKKISYNESKELVNKLINNPNVQENETIINTFLSKSGIEL